MTAGLPRPEAAGGRATPGNIYDLGYQRYEGARLGRPYAIRALFVHTFRGVFGIGRGGRAKIVPIGLTVLAVIPAIVAVGFQALLARSGAGAGGIRSPIRYDTYYSYVATLVMLFVAAQAPEILGRDQRYHVLSLYFSRALRRTDYATAKAAAFVGAILLVVLTPQAIIFLGLTLAGRDVLSALDENLASVGPVVIVGAAVALLLGAIGLAIAAFTPRRAYATAAIIAAFLVPQVVAAIVGEEARGDLARYVVLLSPADVLDGLNAYVFGLLPSNPTVAHADLPGEAYAVVVVIATLALFGLLLQRYRRIPA
jgi:ABC-2 type transport system permease protein